MRPQVKIFRNILGVLLILLGLIMLVTPGQGVLTILLGFAVMDFPGKKRITDWIKGTRIARKLTAGWKRIRSKRRQT